MDEGSSQVVKFGQDGRVLLILGRKPEAVSIRVPRPARQEERLGRVRAAARAV